MTKFLYKTGILLSISVIIFLFTISFPDEHFDPFYQRLINGKKSNLIIGTSRSAQGIVPKILHEYTEVEFYNFSFTQANSPFGKIYFEAIKNKLDKSAKNQIFIISVDPFSISTKLTDNGDELYGENSLFLSYINVDSRYVNYKYLLGYYRGRYLDIYKQYYNSIRNPNPYYTLHSSGWLEINVNMSQDVAKVRRQEKIKQYSKNATTFRPSKTRLLYLQKIINYLNKYGSVYIVRLPVDKGILKLEKQMYPTFDNDINMLENYRDYFDLSEQSDRFTYTDANHLYKESGKEVSKIIAKRILKSKARQRSTTPARSS